MYLFGVLRGAYTKWNGFFFGLVFFIVAFTFLPPGHITASQSTSRECVCTIHLLCVWNFESSCTPCYYILCYFAGMCKSKRASSDNAAINQTVLSARLHRQIFSFLLKKKTVSLNWLLNIFGLFVLIIVPLRTTCVHFIVCLRRHAVFFARETDLIWIIGGWCLVSTHSLDCFFSVSSGILLFPTFFLGTVFFISISKFLTFSTHGRWSRYFWFLLYFSRRANMRGFTIFHTKLTLTDKLAEPNKLDDWCSSWLQSECKQTSIKVIDFGINEPLRWIYHLEYHLALYWSEKNNNKDRIESLTN